MKNRNQLRKHKGTKLRTRLGSCLLAVCLLTGMLPATAQAEEPHSHMLCGGSTCTETGHTCTAATTFTEWTDTLAATQNGSEKTAANSLPTTAGAYYLTQDVALSAAWEVTAGITLCLNGKTVKFADTVVYINNLVTVRGSGARLTLTDCDPSGNGKLDADSKGRVVCVGNDSNEAGELNLYGGKITGGKIKNNSYSEVPSGGGIYIGTSAEAVMYGGSITNNIVAKAESYARGGGVFASGKFTMYGGEIKENSAGEEYAAGTPGNQKVVYAKGGGVCLGLLSDACFKMYGGSITENKVYDGDYAGNGGGVYCPSSIGSSTENKFHVSGNAVISENQKGSNETPNNVCLDNGVSIQVDAPGLGDNARIGVLLENPFTGTASASIVSGDGETTWKGKFFSDADGGILPVVNGELKLVAMKVSSVTAARSSEAEASVTFTSSGEGSYYYTVVESGSSVTEIDTTGAGSSCVSGENTISLDSLSGAGKKDIYLCVKDSAGNVSTIVKGEIPAYVAPATPPEPVTPVTPAEPETPTVPETPTAPVESNTEDDDDEPETEAASEVVQTPVYVTYIVQSGDSMSRIARRNGMSLAHLLALNPQVTNPAKIWPGQVLILGQKGTAAQTAAGTATATAAPAGEYATVQKGDTLSGIASRNGLSLAQLRALNQELFGQKYIFAGQRVRIR